MATYTHTKNYIWGLWTSMDVSNDILNNYYYNFLSHNTNNFLFIKHKNRTFFFTLSRKYFTTSQERVLEMISQI